MPFIVIGALFSATIEVFVSTEQLLRSIPKSLAGGLVLGIGASFAVSDDASEFTWNVYAGPAFKVSDNVTIVAGYRALGLNKERGSSLDADLKMHGPQIGVHIRF